VKIYPHDLEENLKKVPISNIYWEYLKTVEILGTRFGLNEKDAVLAFG